ncbi:unnamed protein product [Ectocarpus sp. 4 AP-2014]
MGQPPYSMCRAALILPAKFARLICRATPPSSGTPTVQEHERVQYRKVLQSRATCCHRFHCMYATFFVLFPTLFCSLTPSWALLCGDCALVMKVRHRGIRN